MNPYRDDLTTLSSSKDSYTFRHLTTENFNEMVQLGINKLHIIEEAMKTGQLKFTETGNFIVNPLEKAATFWDIQADFIKKNGRNPTEDELSEIWETRFNKIIQEECDNLITSSMLGETEQTVSHINNGRCICKRCGDIYNISDDQKDWFISRGLHVPKHCPNCRRLNKKKQKSNCQIEKE